MNVEEVLRMSERDKKKLSLEQWSQVLGFFIIDYSNQQFFTQIDQKQVFSSEQKKREFVRLLLERFIKSAKAQERDREWYGTTVLNIVNAESREYSPATPMPEKEPTIRWNIGDMETYESTTHLQEEQIQEHKRTLGENLLRIPGQLLHADGIHLKNDLLQMLHLKASPQKTIQQSPAETFDTMELGNIPFLDEVYEETETYHPDEATNSWLTHPPNLKEQIQERRNKKWKKKDPNYYRFISSYFNQENFEEYNQLNQKWSDEIFKSKDVKEKYAKNAQKYSSIDLSKLGIVEITLHRGIAKFKDPKLGTVKLPIKGYKFIKEDEQGAKTMDMTNLKEVEVYSTNDKFAYMYSKKKFAYLPRRYYKWISRDYNMEYFDIKPLEHAPFNDFKSYELFDDGEFYSDFIIHSEQEEETEIFKSLFLQAGHERNPSQNFEEPPTPESNMFIEIPDFVENSSQMNEHSLQSMENSNDHSLIKDQTMSDTMSGKKQLIENGSYETLDEFNLDLPFDIPSISEGDVLLGDLDSDLGTTISNTTEPPPSVGHHIKWTASTDNFNDDSIETHHMPPAITIEDFTSLQQDEPGEVIAKDLIGPTTKNEDISTEERLEIRCRTFCFRVLTILSRERLGIDELLTDDMFHHLITIMFSAPSLKHPSLQSHTRAVSKLLINILFHSPRLRKCFCKLLLDQRFTSIFLNNYLLPSHDHLMSYDTVIVATRLLYVSCFDISNTTLFYTNLPWIIADLIMVLERGWYLVGQHTVNKPKTKDDQPNLKQFQQLLLNKNFQLFATEVLKFVHISLERLNKHVDIVKYIYHRQLLNVLRWIFLTPPQLLSYDLLRAASLVIMSSGNTFLKKLFSKPDEVKQHTYKSTYISKSFMSGLYDSVEKLEGSQIFLPTADQEFVETKEDADNTPVDERLLVACVEKIVYMAGHSQYKYKQLIIPIALTLTRVIQSLLKAQQTLQQCVLYENEHVPIPSILHERITRDYRIQMREFYDLYQFNCDRFKYSRQALKIFSLLFPKKKMQLEEKIMEPLLSMEDMRDQLLENGNVQVLHVFKYLILYSRSHEIARSIGLFVFNLCKGSPVIFKEHLGRTTYNFLAVTLENENLIAALPLEQQIKL